MLIFRDSAIVRLTFPKTEISDRGNGSNWQRQTTSDSTLETLKGPLHLSCCAVYQVTATLAGWRQPGILPNDRS
ncbi:hypothetical protein LEP3755_62860 (plasmid) [Leptolyngbya sp. NIES-3755]|nr:hypothetical protein LEP3755_62860 [Leptolyngbya sp. NIES-3755]